MTTKGIELLPKQLEFVTDNTHRHLFYSGAYGAAKSRALCYKLVSRAGKAGAVELLCRKTLESLKKSTLMTLLEPDGDLPPVLPIGTYTHNKSEKIIRINGGGIIMYFGLDDPNKLGSVNGTGCAIDELVDLERIDYRTLNSRVRMVVDGIFRQLYGAGNPGAPSHWAAKKWGLDPGGQIEDDTHRVIQTKTTDNYFLVEQAPDYVASLMKMTGVAFKRYVLGEWIGSDGLVYENWNRDIHAVKRDIQARRTVYAIDPGFTDPFVILELQTDGDKRIHVSREFYQTGVDYEQGIEALQEMMVDPQCDVVVDSAEPSLVSLMQKRGIRATPCIKGADSIKFGANTVRSRLNDPGDGRPRLTVDPACRNTISEFETWEFMKDKVTGEYKDQPEDKNNHAMDALRYGVRHIDGESGFCVSNADRHFAAKAESKEFKMPTFTTMRKDPNWGWDS